ncbi:MAG TPA: DNA polymerase III subunit delta' [Vicinamibacterales bacterium]|nr:DNA polymerase III subunit delta' [Vicinamibacterales bacterium]
MPFRDVIGHAYALELLSRAVARDSLPPTQLFAGPSGVGKRVVALALAQAVNCLSPVPFREGRDSCGQCASCTRIARGVHPDVVRLEPDDEGAIGIDDVREMLGQVGYRPFEGRRRVVIIDEADGLGAPAQSALLKTLEEPPPTTIFILISSRPDALLATVLSRCSRLRFMGLSSAEIARALMARGRNEAEAHAVAATADGSLSRAIDARGDDSVAARRTAATVLRQVAQERGPRERLAHAAALVPSKRKSSVTAAMEREHLATYLRAMSSLLRDVELLSTGADEALLANRDVARELERLCDAYAGGRGRAAFTAVDRAIGALDRNASAKIVADWVVLQI